MSSKTKHQPLKLQYIAIYIGPNPSNQYILQYFILEKQYYIAIYCNILSQYILSNIAIYCNTIYCLQGLHYLIQAKCNPYIKIIHNSVINIYQFNIINPRQYCNNILFWHNEYNKGSIVYVLHKYILQQLMQYCFQSLRANQSNNVEES